MRIPIPQIAPVAIALDTLEASDHVTFSGIDLDSGARVVVTVSRDCDPEAPIVEQSTAHGLVLVLTMQTVGDRQ